jgi:integrase
MKKRIEKRNRQTLLSVYEEDLRSLESRIGKDRSASTWKAMLQGKTYVEKCLKEHFNMEDIAMKELTPQFIHDFSVYLSVERGLRGGTVWLACQQLKGVVTRAYQRGVLTWNPFAGFRLAKNIRPREYLTEGELKLLMDHEFEDKALTFTRDVFVFSAFTGLAFIDLKELKYENIVDINGSKWIVSQRHKTNIPFQVKLLEVPYQVIIRYQHQGEYVFEQMEYASMAKRIHRVMEEVGIRKRISFHCARHTFAVLALNKGMPIESLSRLLGHTNITTTQIYAKITMHKLEEDMNRLAEKLNI